MNTQAVNEWCIAVMFLFSGLINVVSAQGGGKIDEINSLLWASFYTWDQITSKKSLCLRNKEA